MQDDSKIMNRIATTGISLGGVYPQLFGDHIRAPTFSFVFLIHTYLQSIDAHFTEFLQESQLPISSR
jgi:hypothetical protein